MTPICPCPGYKNLSSDSDLQMHLEWFLKTVSEHFLNFFFFNPNFLSRKRSRNEGFSVLSRINYLKNSWRLQTNGCWLLCQTSTLLTLFWTGGTNQREREGDNLQWLAALICCKKHIYFICYVKTLSNISLVV